MAKNKRGGAPEIDWLPLRQAIFSTIKAVTADAPQRSTLASAYGGTHGEVIEATLYDLEGLLLERSGASEATIDPLIGSFRFIYSGDGGSVAYIGSPWTTLADPVDAPTESPVPAGLVGDWRGKDGFVTVGEAHASRESHQWAAVRGATSLVWHQYIRRMFDRAVAAERIILQARIGHISARFERLPSDLWPLLEVVDWQNGVAIAADGVPYWSLHAESGVTEAGCVGSLRKASVALIRKTIIEVFDHAKSNNRKAPNIVELRAIVQTQLMAAGHSASMRQIKAIADAPELKARRRQVGKRWRQSKSDSSEG
jgi:hypothetical protein